MATLKNLVDETTNIKNELKTCHNSLYNTLESKRANVSINDKIPNLIDKINTLKVITNVISAGTNFIAYHRSDEKSTRGTTETTVDTYKNNVGDGTLRVSFKFKRNCNHGIYVYSYVKVVRDGSVISTNEFEISSSAYVDCSVDIDVKNGDTVILTQKHSESTCYVSTQGVLITYDCLIV